ncbi:MAG: OmpA family protein [Thalassospira sp.]|uniref:flagellar motor protein MotB n=1 Tax=Thalassospira sp. TaxID=1912094 RepID=UPI001B164A99|nr:flagellar motor protein MotB [Thalassospira sp.]MBO6581303.1 OmpA family protein [Thalassospira sp.]MBO6819408.1 OmpA family protein [Thalassospira sp.]MBO6888722.1 OmpA family protein [Thalassospira sp.]
MPDIVIKKIKKGGHGHHGGAWKVAYADFVTAMMAFFLLLWLLSSATEEQLQGVSMYFTPETISQNESGSGGLLGGTSLAEEGALRSEFGSPSISMEIPPVETPEEREAIRVAQMEEQEFNEAQEELLKAIEANEELQGLEKNIRIENTDEGLRIQILDEDGTAMFPSGSAAMADHTRLLLQQVAGVIENMPQDVSIEGHTDAVPFNRTDGYSNWELSADRALATRRALEDMGLETGRFAKVAGLSDTDPLLPEAPENESNRRISITLLRGTGERSALEGTGEAGQNGQTAPTGAAPSGPAPSPTQQPAQGENQRRPTFSVPSQR